VKITFAKGAALAAPSGLFNSSLEGNNRKALIRAAVALNTSSTAPRPGTRA